MSYKKELYSFFENFKELLYRWGDVSDEKRINCVAAFTFLLPYHQLRSDNFGIGSIVDFQERKRPQPDKVET